MNSKEAVNSVLNHKQPDFIPIGTYAIDCDTAEKIIGHETYVRNKVRMQIALWEGRRDEVVQSLKEDSVELFSKLDCIDIIIPYKEAPILPPKGYIPPKVKKIDDKTWEDENGTVFQCSYTTNDITIVKSPEIKISKGDFCKEPEMIVPDESIFEAYDYLIKNMKESRFLAGSSSGFSVMSLFNGMENGLMEYYLNPEMIKMAHEYYVKMENNLDKYYIREGIDQVFVEIDPATTTGPLISPAMFREFCLPPMKQRIANLKKYRTKVMMHSCGNTWKLMEMFIEAGVDCNQSLQTGAGMDIGLLKEKFGDRMSFWGGVSVEKLIMGTPDEVREDVRYAFKHAVDNGGFILGPSHSIAYGVNYDNFMAMLDEHSKLKHLNK